MQAITSECQSALWINDASLQPQEKNINVPVQELIWSIFAKAISLVTEIKQGKHCIIVHGDSPTLLK